MKSRTDLLKKTAAAGVLAAVLFTAVPAGAYLKIINPGPRHFEQDPEKEEKQVITRSPVYRVKEGETLTGIAGKFGVSLSCLAQTNNLADRDRIYPGQVLQIPGEVVIHRVSRGETLSGIADRYDIEEETIALYNELADKDLIVVGRHIEIPVEEQSAAAYAPQARLPLGDLPWPVTGWISSPFGIREGRPHEGTDFAADAGEPIRAVQSGRVVFAGSRGTYGLTVIIDHGAGLSTLYSHCSRLLVQEGDYVEAERVIGEVGSTGRSTGPHLHFEVRLDGIPFDPMLCLERSYA